MGGSYTAVDSLAFKSTNANRVVAFKKIDGNVAYLIAGGDEYVKVPWFENRILQAILWIIFLITFTAILVGWGIMPIFKKKSTNPRWHLYTIACTSAINLVFFSAIAYLLIVELDGTSILQYGIPFWFDLLQVLVWVGLALTIASISGAVMSWKKGVYENGFSIKYIFATIVLLLFVPFIYYWNLLG